MASQIALQQEKSLFQVTRRPKSARRPSAGPPDPSLTASDPPPGQGPSRTPKSVKTTAEERPNQTCDRPRPGRGLLVIRPWFARAPAATQRNR